MGGDSGVLTLDVADDVTLGTWNNGISDLGAHTLIEPDSALWGQVTDLAEGDQAEFSGRFVADDDCVTEPSLMDTSSVERPQFILRFDTVDPYPAP